MQKIRETDREVQYAVQSPTEISPDLLDVLMKAGKSVRIEWPRQVVDNRVFEEISNKYYVQFGMEASHLYFSEHFANFVATSFDDETSKRLVAASYENGYADVWKGQLTDRSIKSFRETLITLVNRENTRFINVDGKTAGVIMVDDFETYRGKRESHLGWVWIEPSLAKQTRRSVAASLLREAVTMAPKGILAAVYVRNKKSISFLRNAGFEPICAQFLLS